MNKKIPTIKLILENNYNNFNEFYDENKSIIYKSIMKLFKEFITTRKKTLTFKVQAKINNLEFETDFTYTKKQNDILYRDILPYFENIEDYETCIEIRDLIKKLNVEDNFKLIN